MYQDSLSVEWCGSRRIFEREKTILAEYKKKANFGIGLAIFLMIGLGVIPFLIDSTPNKMDSIVEGVFALPILPFIYGLCCYAKGKGYHGAWGLLGLFTIIGLLILVCFPDRHKSTKESQKKVEAISKSGNRNGTVAEFERGWGD